MPELAARVDIAAQLKRLAGFALLSALIISAPLAAERVASLADRSQTQRSAEMPSMESRFAVGRQRIEMAWKIELARSGPTQPRLATSLPQPSGPMTLAAM